MEESKQKSIEEYLSQGGAQSEKYRGYLEHYTQSVNQRTLEAYSLSQRNKNLEILNSESKLVLDKIEQNRLFEKSDANPLIEK